MLKIRHISVDNSMSQLHHAMLLAAAFIVVLGAAGTTFTSTARAQAASCTVDSLSPNNPTANNAYGFDFAVSSTATMQWIKVVSPSANVSIYDVSAPDWTMQLTSSQVVFNQGSIASGNDTYLHVVAQVGNYFSPTNWTVQVSPNADGSSPIDCGGNLSIAVSDTNPPVISSIASTIVGNAATISWSTDKPADSEVAYGLDSTYGSTQADPPLTTSHKLTVKGLLSNTAYHYQVTSVDQAGNTASSNDNTFMTPPLAPVVTLFSNTTSTSFVSPKNQTSKTGDKSAPSLTITSAFAKVEKQAPTISGIATDNTAVAAVAYSTDNGKDWLPADSAPTLGTPQTAFSFTPKNLEDGSYQIRVRVTDSSGNTTISQPLPLVIDQYPPQVGGSIVSIGPQVLQPDASGIIRTTSGVDQKVTVQALSGAIQVQLSARHPGDPRDSNTFQLTQNPSSGLWSGVMDFQTPGIYQITAHGLDGAGNTTSRLLQTISVLSPAKVLSISTGRPITAGTATLYYLNTENGNWVVWDGAAYGQQNPQKASNGDINLLIPRGTYYLKVIAPNYKPLVSQIFSIDQSVPLTTPIRMQAEGRISVGPLKFNLPNFSDSYITVKPYLKTSSSTTTNALVGQPFPNFSLLSTTGQTKTALDLTGKLGVVSVMSSWSPTTSEQLSALTSLQSDQNITIMPIFMQESAAQARAYISTTGYNLSAVADPHGSLITSLGVGSLPTNYFIDQSGHIKKVIVGVLSKEQFLTALVGQ